MNLKLFFRTLAAFFLCKGREEEWDAESYKNNLKFIAAKWKPVAPPSFNYDKYIRDDKYSYTYSGTIPGNYAFWTEK